MYRTLLPVMLCFALTGRADITFSERAANGFPIVGGNRNAVLVVDATAGLGACERQLVDLFKQQGTPYLIAYNKRDLLDQVPADDDHAIHVSATAKEGINTLKEAIAKLGTKGSQDRPLLRDLFQPGQTVMVVIPIDKAAPKGRLILPEQMAIRDILDGDGEAIVVQQNRLAQALEERGEDRRPALVVTDSQVFQEVAQIVPPEVPLTSFSILMARYKGLLKPAVAGAAALDRLDDGARVLISEGCTHHRQCNDIGTVKLPGWLREYTGKDLDLSWTSGREFPEDLTDFDAVVHCGGCMLNAKEMQTRMKRAQAQGVPMTNYGVAIAHMKGILRRTVALFPDVAVLLD